MWPTSRPVLFRHRAPYMHWSAQHRCVCGLSTISSQHGNFQSHDALGFSTTKGMLQRMQRRAIFAAALAQALPAMTFGNNLASSSTQEAPQGRSRVRKGPRRSMLRMADIVSQGGCSMTPKTWPPRMSCMSAFKLLLSQMLPAAPRPSSQIRTSAPCKRSRRPTGAKPAKTSAKYPFTPRAESGAMGSGGRRRNPRDVARTSRSTRLARTSGLELPGRVVPLSRSG